jgi:class 3 adenylate cyclase
MKRITDKLSEVLVERGVFTGDTAQQWLEVALRFVGDLRDKYIAPAVQHVPPAPAPQQVSEARPAPGECGEPEEVKLHAAITAANTAVRTQKFKKWAGNTGLATISIVFTDMIGSTRMNRKLGDKEWAKVRNAHFASAERKVGAHNGYRIKTIGDAVMAAFRSPVDAVRFAVALEGDTGHPSAKIRAGVHVGQVEITADDAFGNNVTMASRVCEKAKEGGVWVTDHVRQELFRYDRCAFTWRKHPRQTIKGFDGEKFALWSVKTPKTG